MDSLYTLLISVIAFIIALTILVAVHEFGHFWVARKLGVKVLRFSIGFGKPLFYFGRRQDETEYVVAALPLGGYVKMLDEREGEVPKEELHRAFNRQSVYSRFAIVFAGPAINFIFAILAFYLMFLSGIEGIKPILGDMPTDSVLHQSGLRQGAQIVQVGNADTPTMEAVRSELLPYFVDRSDVEVQLLDGQKFELKLSDIDPGLKAKDMSLALGLRLNVPVAAAIIAEVMPDSPAQKGGLQAGDQLVSVNAISTPTWASLVEAIQSLADKPVILQVQREQKILEIHLVPERHEANGKIVGRIGIKPVLPKIPENMFTVQQYGVFAALPVAINKTWGMSLFTLKMLGKMLMGQASLKNVSGPLTIAQYAGYSARLGIERFLFFLGLVSLSLGVINLLPIPMLDGGHLVYYLVEMIKGSPVSEKVEMLGMKIGVFILLSLMTLALFNDFERLLG